MYGVLDKDTIELEIVPYIPKARRGFSVTVPLSEIINAILYKLKLVYNGIGSLLGLFSKIRL